MKIYTSYFYQVRNLPKNAIPLSTAKWDPAWFHANKGPSYAFRDKRGIINGLRAEEFVCEEPMINQLTDEGQMCHKSCKIAIPCRFMELYGEFLDRLNFEAVMAHFETIAKNVSVDDPFIVLLVHEGPSCKCAERPVIQQWFAKHGITVDEWSPNI